MLELRATLLQEPSGRSGEGSDDDRRLRRGRIDLFVSPKTRLPAPTVRGHVRMRLLRVLRLDPARAGPPTTGTTLTRPTRCASWSCALRAPQPYTASGRTLPRARLFLETTARQRSTPTRLETALRSRSLAFVARTRKFRGSRASISVEPGVGGGGAWGHHVSRLSLDAPRPSPAVQRSPRTNAQVLSLVWIYLLRAGRWRGASVRRRTAPRPLPACLPTCSACRRLAKAILQRRRLRLPDPRATLHRPGPPLVDHIIPSSQRPDLFWDLPATSPPPAQAWQPGGGGRQVAVANERTTMLQMARAIQSLSERIFALGERVTQLEQAANLKHANGKPSHLHVRAAHLLAGQHGSAVPDVTAKRPQLADASRISSSFRRSWRQGLLSAPGDFGDEYTIVLAPCSPWPAEQYTIFPTAPQ